MAAAGCREGTPWRVLSEGEATTLGAVVDCLIPEDDDPGEYTGAFGAKPKPAEPPTPPVAVKPTPVVPIAVQKPKMQPAVIAGIVAAALVLVALIVVAVVLSTRSH